MSINASLPLATDLVSAIDDYIREDREQINELWNAVVAANCTETDHVMGAGDFYLAIGTDLEDVMLELVNLTAAVAVDLMQITLGSGGMIKIIRAGDGNVTVKHNTSYIVLANDTDLTLTAGDTLMLVNSGGDPDTPVNGVWYEIARGGSAAGQANTASNVGTGDGEVYKQKTGVDLEFKTIKAGSNITVTNNASDITITSTASGTENSYSAATLEVGDTELIGGTDVGNDANTEVVLLTTSGAAETLQTISNCPAGSVKHVVMSGNNVSIGNSGNLVLRQPDASTVSMNNTDSVSLVNIGGVVGISDGVWYELCRGLAI
jgi:hypothetical protein